MTDKEKRLTDLLRTALAAFNAIPNTRLTDPNFKNTYALARAIENELAAQ